MVLTTALIIGGLLGLTGGAISGIAQNKASNAEYNETIEQLNQVKDDISRNRNNLSDSYNLSTQNAVGEVQDANKVLQANSANVALTQQRNLKNTAGQLNLSDQIQSAQIAELQIQASEAQGQAIQNASMSGFRNSGSASNAIDKATESGNRAVRNAMLQLRLSRMQSYQQAVDNYTSAEYQKQQYAMQIENNQNQLERTLAQYKLNYEQQLEEYDVQAQRNQDELEWMQTTGKTLKNWTVASDYVSSIFSGASSGLSLGYNLYSYNNPS